MDDRRHQSPYAAAELLAAVDDEDPYELDELHELSGCTDCPNGCYVEPDGRCPHGYESAMLTAGLI